MRDAGRGKCRGVGGHLLAADVDLGKNRRTLSHASTAVFTHPRLCLTPSCSISFLLLPDHALLPRAALLSPNPMLPSGCMASRAMTR